MFLDDLEIPGDARKVATFHRNGGNFGPEWVATFKRNGGSFAPDYAIMGAFRSISNQSMRIEEYVHALAVVNDHYAGKWLLSFSFCTTL